MRKYLESRLVFSTRELRTGTHRQQLMKCVSFFKATCTKFALARLFPRRRSNIFDNMLAMMEKYANNLESTVAERTAQLVEEKKKTEALLLRMLPP